MILVAKEARKEDPRSCVLCHNCGNHDYYYSTPKRICMHCGKLRPNPYKMQEVLEYRVGYHFKGDKLTFEYVKSGERDVQNNN
jgi:hypothetical protein